MLCIFQGKERLRDAVGSIISDGRSAGDIQEDIHAQVGPCEHAATKQCRSGGLFALDLVKETIGAATKRLREEHAKKHLPFDASTVRDEDCLTTQVGESRSSLVVFVSPSLLKDDGTPVTIEDFRDNHSFGNGVTANSRVELKDGSVRHLSWCVFPEGTTLSNEQLNKLQVIFEN